MQAMIFRDVHIDHEDKYFSLEKNINFIQGVNVLSGLNGCGKSTTIKILLNLIKSKSTINIKLDDYFSYNDFIIDNVYSQLDDIVFEYEYIKLKDYAKVFHIDINMLFLKEHSDQIMCNLSHGTRKKVAILRGLSSNKKILMFDEITNGIDKKSIPLVIELFNKTDKQIIISTHDDRLLNGIVGTNVIKF